jgi:hypothetical protein
MSVAHGHETVNPPQELPRQEMPGQTKNASARISAIPGSTEFLAAASLFFSKLR